MKRLVKKIPEMYSSEFSEQQFALIRDRIKLSVFIFAGIYFLATGIVNLMRYEKLTAALLYSWGWMLMACLIAFVLYQKAANIHLLKLGIKALIALILSIHIRYLLIEQMSHTHIIAFFILMMFAINYIIPWKPQEIVEIALINLAIYSLYFYSISKVIYGNGNYAAESIDYAQGVIVLFVVTVICFAVRRRENNREIENFILLKELEEKNRQMQKELEMATLVHKRLIPKSVKNELADIAVTYLPAYYIGGDYLRYCFTEKEKLMFIISDVTGHGVSAALLVNTFHAEFERLAKNSLLPGQLLKELDKFIIKDFAETRMFLTAFCGLLDYQSREFIYSNYGHPPQYIYRSSNSLVYLLKAQTTLLGITSRNEGIYQSKVSFDKNDQIFLFTDGVIEAKNRNGEVYGNKRLESFIENNQRLEVEQFNQQLLDELKIFTDRSFKDDICILNIRIK